MTEQLQQKKGNNMALVLLRDMIDLGLSKVFAE